MNAFRPAPGTETAGSGPAAPSSAEAAQEAGVTGFEERSHLVQQLLADLEQAVREVDAVLKDSVDTLSSDAPGTKEARRELAHQFVVGAWMNRENPAWDPAEPATHRPITDDPLLAVLAQWNSQLDATAAAPQSAP